MGGGAQVELHNGQYVGQAEGSWAFRFTVVEDLNLRDDTPVITLRPEEPHGSGLVEELRRLGASVTLRELTHEKIAIIDGRILWHGSLNIFSHRDRRESMLRFESTTLCKQIWRSVNVLTNQHG
jgi:hypothetical protein